jgi:hypothetical protein
MITIIITCIVVIVLIVILIAKANEPEIPTHKPIVRDIATQDDQIERELEKMEKEAFYAVGVSDQMRIYNDSISLIRKTKNYKTFCSRTIDIENFFDWAFKQTGSDLPKRLGKNTLRAFHDARFEININAIRIASLEYDKWLAVDRTSEKKIDKATAKAFEVLDELAKCIKTSINEKETLEQLEHFRTTIEQIYAEL